MSAANTIIQTVPNQYEVMLNNYATIVEKTNQQLGLWSNPYGLMVGLLTVIIALVAIVVSFLLWKNSDEQKKRAKEFFDRQEKDLQERAEIYDKMIKERGEKAKNYEASLGNLIQEYKNKLTSVDKENKEEIERLEKTIDDLNKSKASLGSYAIPEVVIENLASIYSFGNSIHTMACYGCGKKFQYKDKTNLSTLSNIFGNGKKVYCPHCGHENFV